MRNSDVRVVRNGIVVYEGKVASLKRFKDDVREVPQWHEGGILIDKFNDIKEGDIHLNLSAWKTVQKNISEGWVIIGKNRSDSRRNAEGNCGSGSAIPLRIPGFRVGFGYGGSRYEDLRYCEGLCQCFR